MGPRAAAGWASQATLVATVLFALGGCEDERPAPLGGWTSTDTPPKDGGPDYDGGFLPSPTVDPATCEEAKEIKSYVGCDFWPTVTANNVWSIFDYAVVIANTGENTVDVSLSRAAEEVATTTIAPSSLETLYLPWVPELKGPDADECGSAVPVTASGRVLDGAYHLTSTYPVIVYQFNALEYAGEGGPSGKSWASCPGYQDCEAYQEPIGCYSFTNDASLLLPTTAIAGIYRVTSIGGWPLAGIGTTLTITGTEDDTTVRVALSATGATSAGSDFDAISPGGIGELALGDGDVLQLVGEPDADLAGSLIDADKPVHVLTGVPCIYVPLEDEACDHLEETVVPAVTLGQHYFVHRPSGPRGTVPDHVVRIHGNVDGTELSYPSGAPDGAPTHIDGGEVVDLGRVDVDFEIVGTHAFAVATFLLGGSIVDPGGGMGDPSQSLASSVEQYRSKYVFLAPNDYDENYVDVVLPLGSQLTLDGDVVSADVDAIGESSYGVARIPLEQSTGGVHLLEANSLVSIQVVGYGSYTSYHYPGGLDLKQISPPPLE